MRFPKNWSILKVPLRLVISVAVNSCAPIETTQTHNFHNNKKKALSQFRHTHTHTAFPRNEIINLVYFFFFLLWQAKVLSWFSYPCLECGDFCNMIIMKPMMLIMMMMMMMCTFAVFEDDFR